MNDDILPNADWNLIEMRCPIERLSSWNICFLCLICVFVGKIVTTDAMARMHMYVNRYVKIASGPLFTKR